MRNENEKSSQIGCVYQCIKWIRRIHLYHESELLSMSCVYQTINLVIKVSHLMHLNGIENIVYDNMDFLNWKTCNHSAFILAIFPSGIANRDKRHSPGRPMLVEKIGLLQMNRINIFATSLSHFIYDPIKK